MNVNVFTMRTHKDKKVEDNDGELRDVLCIFFFFQAEDGIRDYKVTGVQTCALPICARLFDRGARPGAGNRAAGAPSGPARALRGLARGRIRAPARRARTARAAGRSDRKSVV